MRIEHLHRLIFPEHLPLILLAVVVVLPIWWHFTHRLFHRKP
jgi:hypothetical protein